MAEDPFPRERVGATLRRMPAYLKLSWRLARDPLLSRARRATVIAAAGYLASPVDLVPGIIPVVGQLDDIAFAIAALKLALSGLDPARRREHLQSVGLGDDDLAQDLRTAVVASAWLVRAGARTTGRAAKQGGKAAVVGGKAAVTGGKAAVTGARVAGRATAKTASAAASAASKVAPTARSVATRAGPAAKGAASSAGPAARGAASRGIAAARSVAASRSATSWGAAAKVRVTVRRPAALGPGADPADDRLPLEPDVIELPGPRDSAERQIGGAGAEVARDPAGIEPGLPVSLGNPTSQRVGGLADDTRKDPKRP
jgi:uncharacterized membrane protein YkvA (DUF1232 family)